MTTRVHCTVGITAGLVLAAAVGLGWRWSTTPALPQLPLERMEPNVEHEVREALDAVGRTPRSGEAWGRLGMALAANRYPDQALACLAHAERFDPRNPRWPYLRGTRMIADDPEQGRALLHRALRLATAPAHRAAIALELALTLIRDDELDQAENYLTELNACDPEDPRVHFVRGLIAAARGDADAARQYLTPLTELPFTRKRACVVLAGLPGGDAGTRQKFQQRAALLPADLGWPNPYELEVQQYRRSLANEFAEIAKLEAQGRLLEARDRVRQMVQETPHPSAYQALALLLLKLGELDDAEALLRLAVPIDADNADLHTLLSHVLLQRALKQPAPPGGPAQAHTLFAQALAEADHALILHPEHPAARLHQGRALRALDRKEEAARSFKQAILTRPDFVDAYLELGELATEAGHPAAALEYYTSAQRVALPGDPRPAQALQKLRRPATSP